MPPIRMDFSPQLLSSSAAPSPATLTVSISPVTPNLRNYAVGWVTIAFSAPVKGFRRDLELNGVALPSLTSTDPNQPVLTLTSNDGQYWTLGNLAGYTCVYNSYLLKFNPLMISGITDYASDALSVRDPRSGQTLTPVSSRVRAAA